MTHYAIFERRNRPSRLCDWATVVVWLGLEGVGDKLRAAASVFPVSRRSTRCCSLSLLLSISSRQPPSIRAPQYICPNICQFSFKDLCNCEPCSGHTGLAHSSQLKLDWSQLYMDSLSLGPFLVTEFSKPLLVT